MRLAPQQREVAGDCREFDEIRRPGRHRLPAVRPRPSFLLPIVSVPCSQPLTETTGPLPWSAPCWPSAAPTRPKSLEEWLRDRFFREHCQLFHNRPFIWHVWDGRKDGDGFHALVNYHRLAGPGGEGRRTLESLTFAYLNEWIARQRSKSQEGTPGADGRVTAALDLQQQLERILVGEPPCDIFVRWRPLQDQAIGWEPNIDDGVRLNIRPFIRAELRTSGRLGAGVLRWKPNIKWVRDGWKESEEPRPREDFPWFWGCPGGGSEAARTDFRAAPDAEFDGIRWNDLHYSTVVKRAARGGHQPTERAP